MSPDGLNFDIEAAEAAEDNSVPEKKVSETKQDAPRHIGQDLRLARVEAGLTRSEISEDIKIKSEFLEAIEELNPEALPSIGYVLGYVRAYARHVGMDGDAAVARYKKDSEVPDNLGRRNIPHFVPQRQIRLPRGFFAAVTIAVTAIALAVWYSAQSADQSAAITAQTRLNTPEPGAAEPVVIDPDLMTFKAVAPTWVEFKDKNGEVIISRILVAGESWQTDIDNNVSLSARDSGALELYIGGELIGRLGRKGVPMQDVPMPAVPREFATQEQVEAAAEDAPPVQ